MGTHERIITEAGWQFKRESCGCGGAEKKRTYIKGSDQLIYYTRTKKITVNNVVKTIQEIEANV
jgi:hypothetical protein